MKRLAAVLLSAALAVGMVPSALAAVKDVPAREKEAVLRELEIMEGDETGALHLERNITRAEFTKLLVCASPYKGSVGDAATDPYPDVSHRDWFAPYVRTAVDAGLVKGDLEGYFRPGRAITLAEGATMAVRLLGYRDADFTSAWPTGQLALYRSLDLDEGVTAASQDTLLTRGDCLHLFYNLLTASTRQGTVYGATLGCAVNAKGEVDVPSLFRVEQEGPVVLEPALSLHSLLPFDPESALVYRDNDRATLSDLREWDMIYWAKDDAILFASSQGSMAQMAQALDGPIVAETSLWDQQLPFPISEVQSVTRNGQYASRWDIQLGDVVYWSKYSKSLYVCNKKVSGAVEAISPSLAAPTAVTVAGQTYPLETFEAQYAFSDMGSFSKGDVVTLLLGRTGGVAAVRGLSGAGTGETAGQTKVGVISTLTTLPYTDRSDRAYATKAVVITAADGQSYTYPFQWDEDILSPGDLVRVTVTASGAAVVKLPGASLTGRINDQGTKLGQLSISPQADILDTYGDHTARSVPLSRLKGVTLTGGAVRYYETDQTGAIVTLILSDVTGDLHSYGVMTDVNVVSVPGMMILEGAYTYDIGGRTQVLPVSGKRYSVQKGPFCLMADGQAVSNMKNLTKLDKITLNGSYAVRNGKEYLLSDTVAYYVRHKSDSTYTLSSRERVLASGGALSAWYDKPESDGGRVRVVLAEVD